MKKPVRFKLRPLIAHSLLMAACVIPSIGYTEDIDIFLRPSGDKAAPNVLLVLDNSAANSASITLLDNKTGNKFDLMSQILKIVANPKAEGVHFPVCTLTAETRDADGEILTEATRVPEGCTTSDEALALISSINLGIMMINPGNNSQAGGYILHHVTSMKEQVDRTALWDKVSSGVPKEPGGAAYAKMMHEAYLYFAGKTPYVGFTTNKYDPNAKNGANYRSPSGDFCSNNYILFFGDGTPDNGENTDAEALLEGLNGVLTGDTPDSWFDEYARTLKARDVQDKVDGIQNIITHTILVQEPVIPPKKPTSTILDARALMQKAADEGGGEYALGQDGAAVLKAFFSALRKMQPANSVFAAVTLPVSVNVRGTFLNQVYMGQFRPDEDARPHWPGNLKQYQIYLDANDNPILADRNKNPVEDKAKGFLLPDITSFWTSTSSAWSFIPGVNASDAPDGSVVEKGGVGQKMRSAGKHAARKIYTYNNIYTLGNNLSSVEFATSNGNPNGPTAAKLGVANDAERIALIDWVRGEDNKEDENKNGDFTDNRPYIHGDLLHSRPAVINYNRVAGNNDIMVYYGTNDGIFHAVKGGQDDLTGAGSEKWGIVFPEFFGKLKSLRDNDKLISKQTPKPYFADGTVSVYQNDLDSKDGIGSGDKAYIYIGMRRGGRFAYALNVTNPDEPKHLWKINTSSGPTVNGKKPFAKMGQTWSTLRPATIKALTTGPVIIMGGGYDDLNEDKIPATANTMGQGIYVINGSTGALIKHIVADGMGSMPADLTVLDRDENGKADRIYAPDTKGNVWRADIDDADPDNWTVHHIAALGKAADGTQLDARKFLNKIDVVYGKKFDTILVGSGDREHPEDLSVADRFYMLMDKKIGLAGGKICGTTDLPATCTHEDLTDVTETPSREGTLPSDSNGWYLKFALGEKLINSPLTVNDTVIFGTNTPTASKAGICGNLGEARLYQVGYKTGNAMSDLDKDGDIDAADRYTVVKGGGLLPTGVYSPTTVVKDGKEKRVDAVCVGAVCIDVPGKDLSPTRHRTYWYRKQ